MNAVIALNRYKISFAFIIATAMVLVFAPTIVGAVAKGQECGIVQGKQVSCDAKLTCTDSKCVEADTFGLGEVNTGLGGSLGKQKLGTTIGSIINVALSLLGIVSVVIILAGGFKWMTAGGSEEKTTEARKLIFNGVIGLAIIMSAWAITTFVLSKLSAATGSGTIGSDFVQ